MIGFTQFLTEGTLQEAAGKRTHLTHLEDVVLDDGPSGISFAIKTLKEFGKILKGGVSKSYNVSVKWDGAPAIVFGTDPADGKFFVATKGAFSKSPKLGKSHADIDALYGSGPGAKLHAAFDALKRTGASGVYQGDMLFTPDMLKQQSIDGVTYVTFQPNTILYAVDVNSTLGQRIVSGEFGIVVHTMYTGRGDLGSYTASGINPGAFASLRPSKSLVMLDAGYDDVSGTATFTKTEEGDFQLALAAAQDYARAIPASLYDYILQEPLHGYIAQFVNAQVRGGRSINPTTAAEDLVLFLSAIQEKESAARKTAASKDAVRGKFAVYAGNILRNKKGIAALFATHGALQRAKNLVVWKLGQAARVASFVPSGDGFRVTGPEGFVAVAHDGKAVKLVDRLEFSRLNFTQPKNWQ